ncbi:MAG: hypothetical protein OXT09_18460 [Myxococcales bacterium]|nr:hypothetical protein [Myxococcales bacterium]
MDTDEGPLVGQPSNTAESDADELAAAQMYRRLADLLAVERDCDSAGRALSQLLDESAPVVERVSRRRAALADDARRAHDERIRQQHSEVIERAGSAMRDSFARCSQSAPMAAALQRFGALTRTR